MGQTDWIRSFRLAEGLAAFASSDIASQAFFLSDIASQRTGSCDNSKRGEFGSG